MFQLYLLAHALRLGCAQAVVDYPPLHSVAGLVQGATVIIYAGYLLTAAKMFLVHHVLIPPKVITL